MYGAAGAFRPKPYGVEYRVLSNAWLQSEELMAWVYRTTTKAITDLFEGKAAFHQHVALVKRLMAEKKPNLGTIRQLMDRHGVETPPGFAKARWMHQGFLPIPQVA
jgi:hypothetical protein